MESQVTGVGDYHHPSEGGSIEGLGQLLLQLLAQGVPGVVTAKVAWTCNTSTHKILNFLHIN